MDVNPLCPRGLVDIFLRLRGSFTFQLNGINYHAVTGSLRQHQCQQPATRADIKATFHPSHRCPCAQQNAIRSHFHRTAIVSNKKLFKSKSITTKHGCRL
ncbi:Uncharacterised protein [Shigella sonnei]|nr:Uncharacterised protein [Shigella sonnei]